MNFLFADELSKLCGEAPRGGVDALGKLIARLKEVSVTAVSANELSVIEGHLKKALKAFDASVIFDVCSTHKLAMDVKLWLTAFGKDFSTLAPSLLKHAQTQVNVFRVGKDVAELDLQVSVLRQLKLSGLKVIIEVGKKRTVLEETGEEAGHYIFDQAFAQSATYRHEISTKELAGTGRIRVMLDDGKNEPWAMSLDFRPAAHLIRMRFQRWTTRGITFAAEKKAISFSRANLVNRIRNEILFTVFTTLSTVRTSGIKSGLGFLLVRTAYWITFPALSKKEIWITHDKMYSARDSGEYFYWYLHNNAKKKVVPFYAINKDAEDVKRLREAGANLLHPLSLKHYVYYLHAKVFVTTHSSPHIYNGITGRATARYRDLLTGHVLCIQHGLIMQGVYKTMHQSRAGIERIYCASKFERENILRPEFGYRSEQISLAGMARFDGLEDLSERTLMLAPTWRNDLVGKSVGLTKRRKENQAFLNSSFFHAYAEVLGNKKLLEAVKEANYKLQFVMHPLMAENTEMTRAELLARAEAAGFLDLFNSTVEVVGAGRDKSFDSLIKECSVLVTDYSGIQYDVAYQRKPVIYYHPSNVPPQYDNGTMDFKTMGFGPIAATPKELAAALVAELSESSSSLRKYGKRANDFFEYIDRSNCQRIFEDAYAFTR